MPLIQGELQSVIPFDMWQTLCKYNDGFIAVHSIMVLYKTITNEFYIKQLNAEEKNILKWAALFHDISKRSTPAF